MRVRVLTLIVALLIGVAVAPALAQAPTATISGHVLSADGQPLPGVTVSVASPNLQGIRTAITTANGDYIIPLLPPGEYALTFEIGSFEPVKERRNVAGTQNAIVDVTMAIAGRVETVTVIGDAETFVESAHVATNFKQNLMAVLPSNRTIDAVLLMAPAVHATGPRGGFTINGSQSYENLFMLNGAVVTENLRGQPFTLYIEDAIQETTVSTAGISAEYGRFEGGVGNAITKSGGNTFSGSFRTSMANDSWRSFTPFETTQLIGNPALALKLDKTVPTYEMTMGGPVEKDRLWFFGAARVQKQESTRTTVGTNIPYIRTNDEKRYEGKLTYAIKTGHSLQGSYLALDQVLKKNTAQAAMDLQSLTDQGQPQDLYSIHYTGVVRSNLFLEAQYSARHLKFTNTGADTKDRIKGSLVLDLANGRRYWSPTFCSGSVCDGDEERNNSDVIVKASYFKSDKRTGSHHVVFGYDRFLDMIKANTHGSGSDYRIRGTSSIVKGQNVYPVFLANTTLDYTPLAGLSEGTHLRTHSLFVNDNWRLNNHLSFNVGVRMDTNDATDGGGVKTGDGTTFSPRVSAIWDPTTNGVWAVTGSYARYVTALNANLAGAATKYGNSSTYRWTYRGPLINATANADTPEADLVKTEDAIRTVFAWFDSIGGIDARPLTAAAVPGVSMKIPTPLRSPYSNEYAGGVSRTLGARGTMRLDAVYRQYQNFYALRTDTATGRVTDEFGSNFDLAFIENTNGTERRYAGLIWQASYNFDRLMLGGNYTLSHAYGNLEGETANTGPSGASIAAYPEYKRMAWNAPQGDLQIDQRHRARMWGTYGVPLSPSKGDITLGLVQQFASGVPYGAVGLINPSTFVSNPGYVTPPTQVEYYFTERDAFRTDATYRTDVSVNYAFRFGHGGGSQPELFFHGEVLNVFNQFQLCGCGASVFNNGGISDQSTIQQGARVLPTPFNPFTDTPVQGVNWNFNPNFGTGLNALAYTSPRLFRLSFGMRF